MQVETFIGEGKNLELRAYQHTHMDSMNSMEEIIWKFINTSLVTHKGWLGLLERNREIDV